MVKNWQMEIGEEVVEARKKEVVEFEKVVVKNWLSRSRRRR